LNSLASVVKRLLDLFAPYCHERTTMEELDRMLQIPLTWRNAHDLFGKIRSRLWKLSDEAIEP
jgi:hypothetical protein